MFWGGSPSSEPSLFFSNKLFSFGFEPFQDDFKYDFVRMTNKVNGSVILAELKVALFRDCNNQRLRPWDSPVFQIFLRIFFNTFIMDSPPA